MDHTSQNSMVTIAHRNHSLINSPFHCPTIYTDLLSQPFVSDKIQRNDKPHYTSIRGTNRISSRVTAESIITGQQYQDSYTHSKQILNDLMLYPAAVQHNTTCAAAIYMKTPIWHFSKSLSTYQIHIVSTKVKTGVQNAGCLRSSICTASGIV